MSSFSSRRGLQASVKQVDYQIDGSDKQRNAYQNAYPLAVTLVLFFFGKGALFLLGGIFYPAFGAYIRSIQNTAFFTVLH